ncbi:DUF2752 domain-containing protein [bacterium]|nr:DUF2752 domain-containing protein [bacterium]
MTFLSNAPLQRREKIHASVLAAVLALIFLFTAAPASFRTFLPDCLFRSVTGVPCPSCGLTRSFQAASRLDVTRAADSHVLGPWIYLALFLLFLLSLLRLLTNRRIVRIPATVLRAGLLLFFILYIGVWICGLLNA